MQVRPPGLGTHPSFLPFVLASIPGEVGWGDFCGRWLHTPDLPGILHDGPVTGELARARDVPDDFLSPLPGVLGRGEAMSAVSPSPGSVPTCSLAGHRLCTLGCFKRRGVGLQKQQNLLRPAPCPHAVVSVRRAPQEHTHPSYPQPPCCTAMAKDPVPPPW